MNRKSLFGRLADSTKAVRTAERQEYFSMSLEPLEDRKMLAATVYYNDDWSVSSPVSHIGLDPVNNDTVFHASDFGGISDLTYGDDAFGLGAFGGTGAFPTIAEAIDGTDSTGTLLIGEGTHFESDIVIDKPLSMIGQSIPATPTSSLVEATFIYPEVTSAATNGDFPTGTHSGIIIHSEGVDVRNLTVDGNGNGALGTSLHYHHGITTLYDTPGGETVRNGTLATMQLGPAGEFTGSSVPDMEIADVVVRNVFWHGITMSGLPDLSLDPGVDEALRLQVFDSIVDGVGPATKTADHVGILLQNINDAQSGQVGNVGIGLLAEFDPSGGNGISIANVGVGLKTAPWGTPVGNGGLGNEGTANNRADIAGIQVHNAAIYGVWMNRNDHSTSNALEITSSSFVDGSVGIFIDYSRADGLVGSLVDNYDTGILVQETHFDDGGGPLNQVIPYASVVNLTGPGTGQAGSVGVLVNNVSATNAVFGIGSATSISGFETGVLVEQGVGGAAEQNFLSVDRSLVSGNGTDYIIGDNSMMLTAGNTTGNMVVQGSGIINPRSTSNFNLENDGPDFWDGNAAANSVNVETALPDKAATSGATNITLGAGTTFSPVITGEDAADKLRWDFNQAETYTGLLVPPLNIDGTLTSPQAPYGALTVWAGQVTQDGSGTLTLGGTATNGSGLGYLYGGDGSPDPNNGALYILEGEDETERTFMNVAIKLDPANEAKIILFGLNDRRANTESWNIPTSILNTSTYTTVTINMMAPSLELTENEGTPDAQPDDAGIDVSNITGYVFGGDQGVVNGNTSVPLRFSVDEVTFSSQKNSMLEVSGAIDLGGATLSADIRSGYDPVDTDEFTIVNKTSGGAVTGTFDGLGEGATVTIGAETFTISYVGGDGNDVVLTNVEASFDSTVSGRHIFYDNSKYDGPAGIDPADSSAIDTSKSAYLPGTGLRIDPVSMTSYARGINGVFVDLTGTHGVLSLADFEFAMSGQTSAVNNTPSTWAAAPAPTAFTVLTDTPVAGTDRVEFIWADGAIANRYLEVTAKGNDAAGGSNTNTGLAATDIFYFGNRIGDTFSGQSQALPSYTTTAGDEIEVRAAGTVFGLPVTNVMDFDKNGLLLASDQITSRSNSGFQFKINITNPPAAPAPPGGDDADSAIASALAAPSSSGDEADSGWVADSLASAAAGSGPVSSVFAQLAEADSPGSLSGADGGDDLDSLLDSLLDDLDLG